MPDALIIDDLPNVVIDEEGFLVASFRYEKDAKKYVKRVNEKHACACYSIETREQRIERLQQYDETGASFKETWDRTGFQYGEDALENVKLGWELAKTHLVPNDNAIAIAEGAFKAGFEAGTEDPGVRDVNKAWSAYEPSDRVKDMTS